MTPTDLLILLGGALLLALIAALLLNWRRDAVQDVIRTNTPAVPARLESAVDPRMSEVRGNLLWLLEQQAGQPPRAGAVPVAPEVVAEARALLARRRKIEAIKLVREDTGWGLKESKDFVDELGRRR